LTPIPYALILVDHNELAQAVPGAESVEIIEVIDHHKLGNPPPTSRSRLWPLGRQYLHRGRDPVS